MSDNDAKPSRRRFFAGAATVGAAAAATSVLPGLATNELAKAEPARPAPERGGGYWLSEHVKRYYQTTQI
ncbi:formate dehydrogenase [Simplicispira suum]|uniref:Formate dehydrogenase n=1 Tax=Simplicispira suum TaxID=2109915 RepID=A0A2S0MWQ9_9BURK|nr:formate dehydrogenase [Simplicispira suum]AVO40324.1 formate dehydrogenase [Simplicispira suum]MBW7833371.1 formate dehydrogenase [Simplicispira suum]